MVLYSFCAFAVVIVGFALEQYTAFESALSLNVTLLLVEGTLNADVEVFVTVQPQPGDLADGGL